MGSFDVSCSLTGTPILCGMPCVMVIMKKDFTPFNRIEYDAGYDVQCIIKSKYDDYGNVALDKGSGVTQKQLDEWTDARDDNKNGRYFFFVHQRAWDWAVQRYPMRKNQDQLFRLSEDLCKMTEDHAANPPADASPELKALLISQAESQRKTLELIRPKPWVAEMKSVFIAFLYACRNPLAGYWATGQYYTEALPELLAHQKLVEDCMIDIIKDHPYMATGDIDDDDSVDEKTARKLLAKLKKAKPSKKSPEMDIEPPDEV